MQEVDVTQAGEGCQTTQPTNGCFVISARPLEAINGRLPQKESPSIVGTARIESCRPRMIAIGGRQQSSAKASEYRQYSAEPPGTSDVAKEDRDSVPAQSTRGFLAKKVRVSLKVRLALIVTCEAAKISKVVLNSLHRLLVLRSVLLAKNRERRQAAGDFAASSP
jgi:hypothetical protein